MLFSVRFTALLLAIFLAIGTLVHGNADTEVELIETVSAGWTANRQSFTRITCRYTIIKGTAASREDALKGKLLESSKANCLWVVDEDKERCSLVAEREEKPKLPRSIGTQREDVIAINTFLSSDYLAFGKVRMHSSQLMRGGTLYGENYSDDAGSNDISTPLAMGVMGPGGTRTPPRMIQTLIDRQEKLVVEDDRDVNGTIGVMYSKHDPVKNFESGFRYVFDASRGYLTTQMSHHQGNPARLRSELVITEAKHCDNGAYFPMRSVRLTAPNPKTGKVSATIIQVEELDVESVPAATSFAVPFKKGWFINDRTDPYSQFSLKADQIITATELPKLLREAQQTAKERHERDRNK